VLKEVLAVAGFALGVAASPLPVVAVLVMLLTKRARPNSLVFLGCWVAGNALAIAITVSFAGRLPQPHHGQDLPAESVVLALLGVGLVVMAVISRRGRQRQADPSAPPTWVAAVDNLTPWGGGLIAFSNATTSPKNLALALGAGLSINKWTPFAAARLPLALVYVAVTSLSIVVPVVLYFVGGAKADALLRRWKDKITSNAGAFMEVVLLVLGLGLAAKGLLNLLF
jgi:hypothetical protein